MSDDIDVVVNASVNGAAAPFAPWTQDINTAMGLVLAGLAVEAPGWKVCFWPRIMPKAGEPSAGPYTVEGQFAHPAAHAIQWDAVLPGLRPQGAVGKPWCCVGVPDVGAMVQSIALILNEHATPEVAPLEATPWNPHGNRAAGVPSGPGTGRFGPSAPSPKRLTEAQIAGMSQKQWNTASTAEIRPWMEDPEVVAMAQINAALEDLPMPTRERVLRYALARWGAGGAE